MRFDRVALGPVRAAARSGRGIFEEEAERVIDALLAGPLPEAVGRSLVEHQVVERVVSQMLEFYRNAYTPADGSPLIDAGWPNDGPGTDIGAVEAGKHPNGPGFSAIKSK